MSAALREQVVMGVLSVTSGVNICETSSSCFCQQFKALLEFRERVSGKVNMAVWAAHPAQH